jgi:alpha-galactosidase
MTTRVISCFAAIVALALSVVADDIDTVYISTLDISKVKQAWGYPLKDISIEGKGLSIGGRKFEQGLATHAVGEFRINLKGGSERFLAYVGVDDDVIGGEGGSVEFFVYADGKQIWNSGVRRAGWRAVRVDLDVCGVKLLVLKVREADDGIHWDHADWADAKLLVSGEKPAAVDMPVEKPYILTPKPSPRPRINGPKVFGVRPGHPLLYTIAATGDRPMEFAVDNLPTGLAVDGSTGQITGTLNEKGESTVMLRAKNALGTDEREFRIVVGDTIALTPPLGWNSWNCFAHDIDDKKVRSAADAMVSSGLINHGWSYINIDDCWMVKPDSKDSLLAGEPRDARGMINTNKNFPDMKALSNYVHSKGLKIGIYSSPGPVTCQGYTASYEYEQQDAQQYANWEIDYLKYDWCSYGRVAGGSDRTALMAPYFVMRDALDNVNRDIVYSLCQYGMGEVWKWGAEVGGNCWRTTGDITDTWSSVEWIGFSQDGLEEYARPGRWNDPDMLVVGMVGWGPQLHPTSLTPSEQYSHISLWCLLSAPLLVGCDMTQLDEFTLNLLTNDEVLEVNQDPLGKQANRVSQIDDLEVWVKVLEDGSKAVGLFNRQDDMTSVTAMWSDLDIQGKQLIRDLWRQKDLGVFEDSFTATVPGHGVELVRVRRVE